MAFPNSVTEVVVVVVISFTLTSPLGYAGYHNYDYPYLTAMNVPLLTTNLEPRQGLCCSD
jgi:hypothetical protein